MGSPSEEHGRPESGFAEGLTERLESAPTDERVYRTALELYEPTRVAAIATRADCSKTAARRHLQRLAEIGLLRRVSDDPETFERNESYFAWRRRNRLAELDEAAYKTRLGDLLAEDDAYRQQYGVDEPEAIDPLAYHEHGDPEQVWLELTNWRAIRSEITELRRVRGDEAADEGIA